MRIHHEIAFRALRPVLPGAGRRPRTIFVIGCMRSGSSMLSHVLIANDGIAGYGESHVHYTDPRSISELGYWIFRFGGRLPRRDIYMLDKVLHRSHMPHPERVVPWCDPKFVFMLRRPEGNIVSLARLFYDGAPPDEAKLAHAADYYINRLGEICAFIGALPAGLPCLTVRYDSLVAHPQEDLGRLTAFLGLRQPLSEQYRLTSTTGKWGVGDGSENIRSGRILRREAAAQDAPDIPRLDEARAAHDRVTALLQARGGRP
ncbi:hypothetical protein Ga0609869_003580 [Rhodovulum iodosum]|uniref:Sulfotransferase n=1 Tax=Rhodovulum iodosum TaxID=68291 RepID=A0ABV3Y0T7_9RHOB|nr:sulfotransferase [Rhodovulum robiginosum]RSK38877.1 hypothetical protein EJA01_01635 [Rhodovulum robiginosum]